MLCFYFVCATVAASVRWALASAVIVGVLFAFAQEARGAHFLSHDVTARRWCGSCNWASTSVFSA